MVEEDTSVEDLMAEELVVSMAVDLEVSMAVDLEVLTVEDLEVGSASETITITVSDFRHCRSFNFSPQFLFRWIMQNKLF